MNIIHAALYNVQMGKYLIPVLALMIILSCKEHEPARITIVDIGTLDRAGIAKELNIINKYSPRVVGLDLLLTTDSLGKDDELIRAISNTRNVVMATALHENDPRYITRWDSLEQSHPKFSASDHGFANLTITNDSVIVRELAMRQYYRDATELAFSYAIAGKYDLATIKSAYRTGYTDFTFDKNTFGHYFKIISIEDLLEENFDKSDIIGKIVLMGYIGNKDAFYLNNARTKKISGTEIHACIIREILD